MAFGRFEYGRVVYYNCKQDNGDVEHHYEFLNRQGNRSYLNFKVRGFDEISRRHRISPDDEISWGDSWHGWQLKPRKVHEFLVEENMKSRPYWRHLLFEIHRGLDWQCVKKELICVAHRPQPLP